MGRIDGGGGERVDFHAHVCTYECTHIFWIPSLIQNCIFTRCIIYAYIHLYVYIHINIYMYHMCALPIEARRG